MNDRHFSFEWIEGGGHYRIHDDQDNAIAFTHNHGHAHMVVRMLNSHAALLKAVRAAADHFHNTDAPIGKLCREALEACK